MREYLHNITNWPVLAVILCIAIFGTGIYGQNPARLLSIDLRLWIPGELLGFSSTVWNYLTQTGYQNDGGAPWYQSIVQIDGQQPLLISRLDSERIVQLEFSCYSLEIWIWFFFSNFWKFVGYAYLNGRFRVKIWYVLCIWKDSHPVRLLKRLRKCEKVDFRRSESVLQITGNWFEFGSTPKFEIQMISKAIQSELSKFKSGRKSKKSRNPIYSSERGEGSVYGGYTL